jgi:hypothetical protein
VDGRRRSPSKVKERTHEEATEALHAGRKVVVLRRSATGYITPKDMLALAAEGDPRRARSELGGGAKATADSSPAALDVQIAPVARTPAGDRSLEFHLKKWASLVSCRESPLRRRGRRSCPWTLNSCQDVFPLGRFELSFVCTAFSAWPPDSDPILL